MTDWYRIHNAADVPSPALLIYPERVRENLLKMIQLVGDPARLRPHVKTHKMPDIIRLKRELGIRKFKVATIAEAEMTAANGGEDVLLAYQPVGPNVQRLLKLVAIFPHTHFSTLVDNLASLGEIAAAAQDAGTTIDMYLDLNIGMNRTGIIPSTAALELYRQIAETAGVRAAGLHAYDGHLHDVSPTALAAQVTETFQPVWELRERLQTQGLKVPNLIAAGTPTAKILAEYPELEVGPGTTVLWDFGQAAVSPGMGFQQAAVLLARVISHPAENLICIDLGHKAVASEMPHPRVRFFGLEQAATIVHSEEHLVLEVEDQAAFPVGTVLYGVPKHICPTVALHQQAYCVRAGKAAETWPITARNRQLTI
ncbi:D-TA family PLP-dependent enzyme [Planctomycetaceae bacterium SH139]